MALIDVTSVNKKYGRKEVLHNITFSGKAGDCIGIIGPNGCGKSTLLKILSGALKPTGGSISLDGNNPLANPAYFGSYTGYVPQENPLFANLTVKDNLKLWYCDSKHDLAKDINEGLIYEFGITPYIKTPVYQLSGGMRKRLSIVCALAKDPKILILDEPGASLDIIAKNDIKTYMHKYTAAGGTIIIASHEEGELSVCNKMYLMNNGILEAFDQIPDTASIMERMVRNNA